MYAISALLYQQFFQTRQARQHYVALSGQRACSAVFNKLNQEISKGAISENNLALLLKDGISPRTINHALVKTQQQKQQRQANIFQPSLTAVFAKTPNQKQQSSHLTLPFFYRARLYNVALPKNIAEQNWQQQQRVLTQCSQRYQQWFTEKAAASSAVKSLGEICAYRYRVTPHIEAELSSSGHVRHLRIVNNG